MNKISILIFILILSILGNAQETPKRIPTWRNYFSPKDDFSVEVPNKVNELFLAVNQGNTKNVHTGGQYKALANGEYFYILTAVVPNPLKVTADFSSLPPWEKTLVEENTKDSNIIKIQEYFGTQWNFKDKEEFTHKVAVLQTKSYLFVFHTVVENPNTPNVDRFFGSIRFYNSLNTKKLKRELNKSNLLNKAIEKSNKNSVPINQGIGIGGGRGSTELNNTNNLQITGKPRAEYTDLARFYQVEGTVTLRVTFLADGNIGEIKPETKLPFGLTINAVNAAKQIKFLPPTKDGVPYSVTKRVHYSFTLY